MKRTMRPVMATGVVGLLIAGLGAATVVEVTRQEFDELAGRVAALERQAAGTGAMLTIIQKQIAELRRLPDPVTTSGRAADAKTTPIPGEMASQQGGTTLPRYSLDDLPPVEGFAWDSLVGCGVFGKTQVLSVRPSTTDSESYDLLTRAPARWRFGAWWSIHCLMHCNQDSALRLERDDWLTLVGTVERVELTATGEQFGDYVFTLFLSGFEGR